MLENKSVPLYVFPCFMKSSKRYFVVKQTKYKKDKEGSSHTLNKSVEDTSSKEGVPKSNLTDRAFNPLKEDGLMNIMDGNENLHH